MAKISMTPATWAKTALLTLVSSLLVYVSIKYAPIVVHLISNPQDFQAFIARYGPKGVGVYISFQILQVVIAVIPGELVQIAGGFIYGFWQGTFYSVVGIALGSTLAFYLARFLGYPLICLFFDETQIKRFSFYLNSRQAEVTTFILFLIPGLPKDMLTYLAGLTPILPANFLLLAMTARLPGIIISSSVGSSLGDRNYLQAIILSVVASVLFLLGLLAKNHLHRGNDA